MLKYAILCFGVFSIISLICNLCYTWRLLNRWYILATLRQWRSLYSYLFYCMTSLSWENRDIECKMRYSLVCFFLIECQKTNLLFYNKRYWCSFNLITTKKEYTNTVTPQHINLYITESTGKQINMTHICLT